MICNSRSHDTITHQGAEKSKDYKQHVDDIKKGIPSVKKPAFTKKREDTPVPGPSRAPLQRPPRRPRRHTPPHLRPASPTLTAADFDDPHPAEAYYNIYGEGPLD